MSEMKEFWNNIETAYGDDRNTGITLIKDIRLENGLFFWERGGKQFVNYNVGGHNTTNKFEVCVDDAKYGIKESMQDLGRRDFLDCVACLGKKKVKELIGELK